MEPLEQINDITRTLKLLFNLGEVTEVRALYDGSNLADVGRFDNWQKLAESVQAMSERDKPKGVYIALNPVRPEKLDRAPNMILAGLGEGVGTADILYRRNLLIDIDAKRANTKQSSTDEEHEKALAKARQIRDELTT